MEWQPIYLLHVYLLVGCLFTFLMKRHIVGKSDDEPRWRVVLRFAIAQLCWPILVVFAFALVVITLRKRRK